MDFELTPEIETYRKRVRAFVDAHVLPLEADRANFDEHESLTMEALARLRNQAKSEGLWALQISKARGGGELSIVGMAACYEEMGRSLHGPAAFNSQAPDDGNMMLLEKVATDAQKDKWLQPIVDGRVWSAFAMTEPAPGSGSDQIGRASCRERV